MLTNFTCVLVSCGVSSALFEHICVLDCLSTHAVNHRVVVAIAALACATYVTIGVSGCSDRQKRKERRQADRCRARSDDHAARGLRQHLLDCELGDEEEPLQVGRNEIMKLLAVAVCATFSAVTPWPMSPSTNARFGNFAKAGNAARRCNDVITTTQKGLDNQRLRCLARLGLR